ncbi:recombinase family protein [Kovacikia minuta CCNUW1]|uniref:recombinase family protein n=1 Tax=Kovacikia minuta TaxID=2931930 RepID=UPI001CCDE05F|nr:recombinase family protein [Kovacikia minuta]UBF23764.1 recombinase family protein [Kovacikia minuta CCNUW1]
MNNFINQELVWITGPTRSGKTTRLVEWFRQWDVRQRAEGGGQRAEGSPQSSASIQNSKFKIQNSSPPTPLPGILVLAAIGDNRLDLVDRLTVATEGKCPFHSTTPQGFFQDEVTLFWSLLVQELDLKAQFPLRLAPENEQELAAQLWQPELDRVIVQQSSIAVTRLVRRVLDLRQLAGLAGVPIQDIPAILQQGFGGQADELPIPTDVIGDLLQRWQTWCLERGLLTYGITAGLYWQYLLPHPTYREHLVQRYRLILADDVDEYPAIARSLFEVLLDAGATAVFTFNPDGAVRLGLGADPDELETLAARCQVEPLNDRPVPSLLDDLGNSVVELVTDPVFLASLPESVQLVQTTSRAQLLRRMAEIILEAVQTRQVEPRDVAVIAPGLDPIARYSLVEILAKHQIPVESLNDQRPLTSSPIIRALLTLLTLVYPGLGQLVDRNAVAEMLVVLSENRSQEPGARSQEEIQNSKFKIQNSSPTPHTPHPTPQIDPVRAGLLADYCFAPHPDRPRLLPVATFPRWDRLGYQATAAYEEMLRWIEIQQTQLDQRLIPNAVSLLDRAIQHFFLGGGSLPFDQLAALRQLLETAQHYWEVSSRLKRGDRYESPAYMTVNRFIQLLRSDTVTANPYPVRPIGPASNAVTLANVFQYRSSRRAHRWQFWLDTGSPRWLMGVDALFAAPLFIQAWSGRPWTAADTLNANEHRLRRILLDLLGRAGERLYLCHSDLATNGQEQTGILLSLVNAAVPLSV